MRRNRYLPALLAVCLPLSPQRAHSQEARAADAAHLLSRISLGARPGDVARVLELGIDSFIELQLTAATPNADLDSLVSRYALIRQPITDLARIDREQQRLIRERQLRVAGNDMAPPPSPPARPPNLRRRMIQETQQRAIVQAISSETQLLEVMVDFWTNHFNVFIGKGPLRFLTASYVDQVIRPNALGQFESLLVATAQSPAMLVYLDNAQSVAAGAVPPQVRNAQRRLRRMGNGPRADSVRRSLRRMRRNLPNGLNENYARELLELHTVGVDAGYTQQNIIETARALTGWSVDPQNGFAFRFNQWAHAAGPTTVMGRDLSDYEGIDQGLALLDFLANHPATMHHVSAKLCARFVADDPPEGCIDAAVGAWRDSNGDIRAVVRAILHSPDFWDDGYRMAKTKTPLEFVVSAVRALDARADTTMRLTGMLNRLGQPPFGQSVPTGYPESQESWINTGAMLDRFNIAMALASGRSPVQVDLADVIPTADDPTTLVARVNDALLGGRGSAHTLDVIRRQVADLRPRDARTLAVALALGSPEFQRQ
ncbi:MAG: DUF1800 domain-containing protein [Gemmatimonadales bacterium]